MTTSEMTTFEPKEQTELNQRVDQFSASSSPKMLFSLRVFEYLFLAVFVFLGIITFIFPDDKRFFLGSAISVTLFLFLFLINRQLIENSRKAMNQSDIAKKAELYTYLMADSSLSAKSHVNLARENALQYCQELIDDYKNTRSTTRNIYYIFQMATVVLSGLTPILVLVDKLEAGQAWLKWLPVIFPAVASIVASIVTSFPFQENSISANAIVELLEAEQEKFILGVTPAYRCYDVVDEAERQQKAKASIENFIDQVNSIHLKQLQASGDKQSRQEQTTPSQSQSNQEQGC